MATKRNGVLKKAVCQVCERAFSEHLLQCPPVQISTETVAKVTLICGPCWLGISNSLAALKGLEPLRTFKDPVQRRLLQEAQTEIRQELVQ